MTHANEDFLKTGHIRGDAPPHSPSSQNKKISWVDLCSKLLTLSGTLFIVTGAFFFFAYNWKELSPIWKFSIIQSALFLCTLLCIKYEKSPILSQAFAIGTSSLIGIFLAVLGQIYQTGADSYGLFLLWSILILPFALFYGFAVVWCMFFILSQLGLILWFLQSTHISGPSFHYMLSLLTFYNVIVYVVRELLLNKHFSWLQESWMRHFFVIFMLFSSSLAVITIILEYPDMSTPHFLSLGIFFLIHLGLFLNHIHYNFDGTVLALSLLSVCCVIEAGVMRIFLIKEWGRNFYHFNYIYLAILSIFIFSVGIMLYQRLTKMRGRLT